jgi:hypothetical protein
MDDQSHTVGCQRILSELDEKRALVHSYTGSVGDLALYPRDPLELYSEIDALEDYRTMLNTAYIFDCIHKDYDVRNTHGDLVMMDREARPEDERKPMPHGPVDVTGFRIREQESFIEHLKDKPRH